MSESLDLKTELQRQATVELAAVGPYRFNTGDVCKRAGVTQAMVNYYFGGRWGLIESAVVVAYQEYVELMISALKSGSDPEDNLLRWASAQADWTIKNVGIAVVLNYQNLVPEFGALDAVVKTRILELGARHFDAVVDEVRRAKLDRGYSDIDDARIQVKTATFMWTVLGLSTWTAGHHLPTHDRFPDVLPLGLAGVRSIIESWLLNPDVVVNFGQADSVASGNWQPRWSETFGAEEIV